MGASTTMITLRPGGSRMQAPYDDLRSFLTALEAEKQLLRIERKVKPEPDLGAAGRAVANLDGATAPALLFENINGFDQARVALNVHGSWANHALPVFRLNPADGGPYVDKAAVITRDAANPDSFGKENVGIYQLQVKRADHLGLQSALPHDFGRHIAAWEGQQIDPLVANAIGNDPVLSLVASTPLEYDQSEDILEIRMPESAPDTLMWEARP